MLTGEGAALALALAAALVAGAAMRVDRPLAIAAATVQRLLVTLWIILRYAAKGVRLRLAGKRDLGPRLVRGAFEELGPTYLKLGQMIASSQGLFPERYSVEFQKTLDRVRPFGFDAVERTLREELHAPPEELFCSIERAPLASASIAQVHVATLADGRDVVLKIQRPHIERRVSADMRILRIIAEVISLVPTVELANPKGVIADFAQTLGEELDFRREAANMQEFNRIMAELGYRDVRAPRVEPELSTRRVITMERFHGIRVDDVDAMQARAVDTEERLIHGLRSWFQCMIFYGFFHGDVHAGNLMLLDDGALGFLDFGIIGRFGLETRRQVTSYVVAFAGGDFNALTNVLKSMDAIPDDVNLDLLARDLEKAYAPILDRDFGALNYGDVLPGILRTSIRHRMRMPREFVLVTKQMVYFDRYAKLLAPRLNIFRDPRVLAGLAEDVMRAHVQYAAA